MEVHFIGKNGTKKAAYVVPVDRDDLGTDNPFFNGIGFPGTEG